MLDLRNGLKLSLQGALALLCVGGLSVAVAQPSAVLNGERKLLAALPTATTTSVVPVHRVFDDLLSGALREHPSVRSAQSQASGAKLDVDVAKWAFWPTVSVSTQRTDGQSNAQTSSTVSVQQPVWSGGALTAKVAVTEKLDQASAQQVSVVQGELGLRLVDIWAALLDAEANRQVTQRTLDVLTRYQDIMKRRVSAGLSSNVELRLLAVRVSRAQTDLADAKVSLQIAAQRMAQIVGAPVDSALPELLKPIAQERLAEWVRQQSWAAHTNRLDQHPAVRKAELDAAAAADQLVVQKAERMPKLVLGYQRQLGDLPVTTRDRSAWTLGLNYTPGAGLASFTQSAADSARLQARLEAVDTIRQEKREQLLLDWSALQREFDRRASLEATISSASDVLASYERQYFGGLKSWLEVLNAVQELTQSELRLAQAGNATTLAYYRWRLRGGELPHQTNWMQ
jgi:adhesin transport system outer membrane protein